jgi:hypothetical protein
MAAAQSLQHVAIGTDTNGADFVLDVSGASTQPGAPVIQWYGNFGTNQRWSVQDVPDDAPYEEIVNQNSGQCLTTDGRPGDWVYQEPCAAQPEWQQLWKGTLNDGPFAMLSTLQSPDSLFLDVEGNSGSAGAHLITWYSTGGNNQYFNYYQLW